LAKERLNECEKSDILAWRAFLEKKAKALLTDRSHDWPHTGRVLRNALRISQKQGGDREIIVASVLLHDIGYARNEEHHETESARMAGPLLKKAGFPKTKIPAVLSCIRKHRFSKGHKAETMEEQILQDADKLDAMGAIGVARCFLWTGERRMRMEIGVEHFHDKLLKLGSLMNTKQGRRMAKSRHDYMIDYLKTLEKE